MSAPDAFVYVDLADEPILAGRLWTHRHGERETASFEYDPGWLDRSPFALDPALFLGPGAQHTPRSLFGAIGDSAPDRWGRMLLQRRERLRAKAEGRARRQLLEIDYLLGHADLTRQGALRFKTEPDGLFLAEDAQIPPLVDLARLLQAADRVLQDNETDEDLRLLLEPGASLQGSRPKASVLGRSGELMIAKFNKPDDAHDVSRWEAVAMSLARSAGLRTATWVVEEIQGRNAFLMQRFDRSGRVRTPFISAMSMLEAVDGERRSYLEIADVIRRHSAAASEDLRELWRRMVFTVLISNTDDHLRNHGFLYAGAQGWRLSPAYDLNPMNPDHGARVLSTALVDSEDRSASIGLAFEAAPHFGIDADEARRIAQQVAAAVSVWRDVARRLRASVQECDRMADAFEHRDLRSLV